MQHNTLYFVFCSGSGWRGSKIASWWGPEAVLIFVKCILHACMTCMTGTIQACKMHRLGRVVKICRLPGIPYNTFYNWCFQSKVQVARTPHAKTRGRRILKVFFFKYQAFPLFFVVLIRNLALTAGFRKTTVLGSFPLRKYLKIQVARSRFSKTEVILDLHLSLPSGTS